jgi:hypothetical protein
MRSWTSGRGYTVSGYKRIIESDRRDAELMLSITCFPYMLGTALAQEMNPNFNMPRPLARIAPKFYGRADAT